ncbi:polysaccharide pyruvyl transferase family protein [Pseudomonas oryzihabitans]|uniref:polysaccharide pyruvyl transferase family protein n=1 Tax=Pseudomonas oryzihabitans TaxID=47885 RepID=UPI00285E0F79|nr:polysaccharide pyruvyl transferase family protein [Pseudomonas psychrotolerans]MDR6680339.1 polysaccharide pyruvyl transferase WcaK-like protein [Pseudomonas psychrotolerans]
MNILVVGVPFSRNLGDGVIFDNLRYLYKKHSRFSRVIPLDLAGRETFESSDRPASNRVALFSKLPGFTRKIAVAGFILASFLGRWRGSWKAKVVAADVIVIGGGQLFLDESLNFPLKLYLFSLLLKHNPAANRYIAFVGVAPSLSRIGRFLFRAALDNIRPQSVTLRDPESRTRFADLISNRYPLAVAADPALFSAECYGVPSRSRTQVERVGLCIADPRGLDVEGRLGEDFHTGLAEYFARLARALHDAGYQVVLFTNGALEDEALKDEIHHNLALPGVQCLERPLTPGTLVGNIATFDLLVAHRLHANIIALALGVPSIGLRWDAKVESFFRMSGRSEAFLDDLVPTVPATLARLEAIAGAATPYAAEVLAARVSGTVAAQVQR